MARLALFSPMPPARSGVAVYSADLVERLRRSHLVHVFVDEPIARAARQSGRQEIRSAHDFIPLNHAQPFDLTIFQLGNSSAHDFVWAYLLNFPGLTVLHDVHLHHARAAALMRQGRADDYRREFAESHPDVSPDMAELAVRGFDSHLYYRLPMTRVVVEASRITAVHTSHSASALREEYPAASIERIRLGHGTPLSPSDRETARRAVRESYDLPLDAVVFGVFGGLAPEKRVPQVLSAFAATRRYVPHARLLLAGAPAGHYDVMEAVRARGLTDTVTLTGYVEDDQFTGLLAAVDVSLNLRWPTAREVSGPWVRALAAGCATITTDLWHTADVPGLDPRTWTVMHASPTLDAPRPVTVKIDILDEDHSLRLAMRRLAIDAELREKLGRAGRAWWDAEHTIDGMAADYERVIAHALATPARKSKTGRNRSERRLRELLEPFGLPQNVWSKM